MDTESIVYRIAHSRDSQRTRSTNAEYSDASDNSIKALNKELKEPSQIVFFAGGVYECTINDSRGRYNQSQLAFMVNLPPQQLIDRYDAIPLWIAPPGTQHFDFDQNNIPSEDELKEKGWNEVVIGISPEKNVSARGGIHAKRLQYSLKHIGAITINKSQGETLPLGIAVEITQQYSPWEKGQIVVALSRTTNSRMTVIVGEKSFAIKKIWELITIANQWTLYTSKVLSMISLNSNSLQEQNNFDLTESYPFCLNDGAVLPTDNTGYVYCLVSKEQRGHIYIGETKCLSQRLMKHNSGSGSLSTENLKYRPWAVAAYICGLGHMTKVERMSLERRWKVHVQNLRISGHYESISWINIGSHIVEMYNSGNAIDKIRYVGLVSVN